MNFNDLSIEDTTRGGDFEFYRSDFVLTAGLRNNVYLSLFGGNIEQSSNKEFRTGEERFDWWGNQLFFEGDLDRQFNSETEKTLTEVAVDSAGRSVIEAAVLRDLQSLNSVADIEVEVTLESIDRIKIKISVIERTTDVATEFEYLWDAAREDENARAFREIEPTIPDNAWTDGEGNAFTDGLGNIFTIGV